MTILGCHKKRGSAKLIRFNDSGAPLNKELKRIDMPPRGCYMNRGHPIIHRFIDLGFGLNKQLQRVRMTILGCQINRGYARLIRFIDIDLGLNKSFEDTYIVVCSSHERQVKQRAALYFFVLRVFCVYVFQPRRLLQHLASGQPLDMNDLLCFGLIVRIIRESLKYLRNKQIHFF